MVNKNNNKKNIIIMGVVIAAIIFLAIFSKKDTTEKSIQSTNVAAGGDLKIVKVDITEEAKFYGYQSNDTYIEIMAVRASDGTVRTALNTCQVCNNSGKGYYVQEEDVLICQNCGNGFTIDQVGVVQDGCNPVPIEQNIKIEDEEKVIIKGDLLAQYEPLFAVWKK